MLNLADAIEALWLGLNKTVGDDLNAWGDALTIILNLRKEVADTMAMKDFFELDIDTVTSFADSMNNWSDALTKTLIGIYTQTPSDTMSMSDGVALLRKEYLQVGDSLKNYLEALKIVLNLFVSNSDSINNWADAIVVNRISNTTISVADSMNNWLDGVDSNLAEVSNCFA